MMYLHQRNWQMLQKALPAYYHSALTLFQTSNSKELYWNYAVDVSISVLIMYGQENRFMIYRHSKLYISGALRKGDLYELGSHPRAFCTVAITLQIIYSLLKQA